MSTSALVSPLVGGRGKTYVSCEMSFPVQLSTPTHKFMSCLVRKLLPSFFLQVATTYLGSCHDQVHEAANPAEASSGRAARARVRAERVSFIFVLLADDLMSWMVLLISNLLSERQRGGGFYTNKPPKIQAVSPYKKVLASLYSTGGGHLVDSIARSSLA